jgi:O-methyltransferase
LNLLESGLAAFLQSVFQKRNLEVVNFNDPDRKTINSIINQIRKETELLISNTAAQQLYIAVKATGKIAGDIAEVGVYRGGSAKVICMAKGDRNLHLFDTFKGIPEPGKPDDLIQTGAAENISDVGSVKTYLAGFSNVHLYEGMFPDTAGPIEKTRFSLVHLDVGLFESAYDSLEFFYPRVNRGGVIISHDYSYQSGVKRAFDEFFVDKPEIILDLTGYQCLVIKL